MYNMFRDCKSLNNITALANWNVSNVTNMGYMFEYCSNLTILDISGWNTSKVNSAGSFLEVCSKLTTCYILYSVIVV